MNEGNDYSPIPTEDGSQNYKTKDQLERFGSVNIEKRMMAAIDGAFSVFGKPGMFIIGGTGIYGEQPKNRFLPFKMLIGLAKDVARVAVSAAHTTIKLAVMAAYKVPMLAIHGSQAIGYGIAALGRGAMMLTNLPRVMLGNEVSKKKLSANWAAMKDNMSRTASHGKEAAIAAGVIGIAAVAGVFIASTAGVGAAAMGFAAPALAPIIGAGHAAAGINAAGIKIGTHVAAQVPAGMHLCKLLLQFKVRKPTCLLEPQK